MSHPSHYRVNYPVPSQITSNIILAKIAAFKSIAAQKEKRPCPRCKLLNANSSQSTSEIEARSEPEAC